MVNILTMRTRCGNWSRGFATTTPNAISASRPIHPITPKGGGMSIASVSVFTLQTRDGRRLTLRSEEGHVAHIFAIDRSIVRVMVLPFGQLRHPQTWAIAPGLEDVPLEGRDRFDLTGYDLPEVTLEESPVQLRVTVHVIRLTISLIGLRCQWE